MDEQNNLEGIFNNFLEVINKFESYSLITHYNPDPDAIGGVFALSYLLTKKFNKKCAIYYSGVVGRAENKTMLNVLDIDILKVETLDILNDTKIMLLDSQPGSGNNPLDKKHIPYFCFDHHPLREDTAHVKFADIRLDFGSTCSIIYSYFKAFQVKPSVNVATALYYGIQSDVIGEGRTTTKRDIEYLDELAQYINREKLYQIENPKLPYDYYTHIFKGVSNGVVYDDFLITSLGEIENPDYIGEVADFLIRFEKVFLVLVLGVHKDIVRLSFRSQRKKYDAGELIKKIVGTNGTGGGHVSNSGGQIILTEKDDAAKVSKKIITKSLSLIKNKIISGIPFLSLKDY